MLTAEQAKKIVDAAILEVARGVTITPGKRVTDLGIDNKTKLARLQAAIVSRAGKLRHKVSPTDLKVSGLTTVADLRKLVRMIAREIFKPETRPAKKKSSALGRGAKARGTKTKSSGTRWKTKGSGIFPSGRQPKGSGRHIGIGPGGGSGVPLAENVEIGRDLEFVDIESSTNYERESYTADAVADYGGSGGGSGGVVFSESTLPPHITHAKPPLHEEREQQQQQQQQQMQDQSQQAGDGGEKPTMRTIECTPQIEKRKEIDRGKAYQCAVWVDQGPAAKGADVQRVKVELPVNVETFSLDVWFDSSSHFAVEDIENPPTLEVKVATGASNERTFTLRLLKEPDEKPMFVTAFFRFNGRPCGKITRFIEIDDQGWRWKEFVPSKVTEGTEVVLPNARVAPGITVETTAEPAEIRVEVLKTEDNDLQHFTMKCWTPQDHWEGAWNLPQVTKDLVKEYMQRFMSSKEDARIASLQGAGVDLWKVLPKQVKTLLWDALENNARTMSVISEEPYIPWELMVPFQSLQNQRKALGVELQFGRWVTGDYKSAKQKIPMKTGYVIAPTTSGLKSSTQEVSFLTQQLKPDFSPADTITPASFKGVNQGLSGPARDVIHFICHGKSATLQTLELEKPDTLDCSQVQTLAGFLAAFKSAPLAFLNACEVGGVIPALDGVGGFANSFIELGASAVVAPLWAVQDGAAFEVTKAFYQNSLKGVPFAETMRQIRARAYSEAVDSYAAYCFYGDPMARAA